MIQTPSALIATAERVDVRANATDDTYFGGYSNSKQSTAFVIANGTVGDDHLVFFGRDDSIITGKKLFDGNKDGLIGFGENDLLDVDRTSARNAGEDQLALFTTKGAAVTELRYLGTKGGQYAYADSATLHAFKAEMGANAVEGTVGNDTYQTESGTTKTILFDNLLGLSMGEDVIASGGFNAWIVTTAKLADVDNDGRADNFNASTGVLDLGGGSAVRFEDTHFGQQGDVHSFEDEGQIFYVYSFSTP